jgi:hypothetical protein
MEDLTIIQMIKMITNGVINFETLDIVFDDEWRSDSYLILIYPNL